MSSPADALTEALAPLNGWDGDDPAALDALLAPAALAVRRFASEATPAETRGPAALAAMASANAIVSRALSRAVAGEARAAALGDEAARERWGDVGRRLKDAAAQLARETAARVSR